MFLSDSKQENKIIQALTSRYEWIESNFERFQNNPYQSEYIHRLRVELRKIRALLHFLKPIINQSEYKRLNKNFRDLGKILSELRDIDSLIEHLTTLASEQPQLLSHYSSVFGFLEDERLNQAHLIAEEKSINKMRTKLIKSNEQLKKLTLSLKEIDDQKMAHFIITQYIKKGNKLKKKADNLNTKDYRAIHELRKDSKKVRYAAVSFKSMLPKKIRKPIKKNARNLQEQLGEITDLHVSIEMLSRYKEQTQNDELRNAFQTLINEIKASR